MVKAKGRGVRGVQEVGTGGRYRDHGSFKLMCAIFMLWMVLGGWEMDMALVRGCMCYHTLWAGQSCTVGEGERIQSTDRDGCEFAEVCLFAHDYFVCGLVSQIMWETASV